MIVKGDLSSSTSESGGFSFKKNRICLHHKSYMYSTLFFQLTFKLPSIAKTSQSKVFGRDSSVKFFVPYPPPRVSGKLRILNKEHCGTEVKGLSINRRLQLIPEDRVWTANQSRKSLPLNNWEKRGSTGYVETGGRHVRCGR